MESKKCKNCDNTLEGKYCSECGQLSATGRINLHYLIHEVEHSILHVDKGILYTIKELFLRPGYAIKEYLDGKRVRYFKPFAFVLILGTIYGFIAHFFKVYPETHFVEMGGNTAEVKSLMKDWNDWFYSHYSLAMLAFIPFLAISSFLIFKKSGLNYTEHLIINSYIIGQQILFNIIIYPLYYYSTSGYILSVLLVITTAYNVWAFSQLFKTKSWTSVIIKSILSITIGMFIMILVGSIIGFAIAIIGLMTGTYENIGQ